MLRLDFWCEVNKKTANTIDKATSIIV